MVWLGRIKPEWALALTLGEPPHFGAQIQHSRWKYIKSLSIWWIRFKNNSSEVKKLHFPKIAMCVTQCLTEIGDNFSWTSEHKQWFKNSDVVIKTQSICEDFDISEPTGLSQDVSPSHPLLAQPAVPAPYTQTCLPRMVLWISLCTVSQTLLTDVLGPADCSLHPPGGTISPDFPSPYGHPTQLFLRILSLRHPSPESSWVFLSWLQESSWGSWSCTVGDHSARHCVKKTVWSVALPHSALCSMRL